MALLEDILDECADDHVGLWSVLREVRGAMGNVPPDEVQSITLELLRFLLHRRLIEAGFPASNGRDFDSWKTSPDETIQRIAEAWNKLGRDPSGGEIIWFTTPNKAA
ncbi:MAG TPA: hypothetical protein VIK18_14505 [Pirellulales bacterium]